MMIIFFKVNALRMEEQRKEWNYSKNCKDSFLLSEYNKDTAKKEWEGNSFPVIGQITIANMEEKQVAYVRHTGTYETLAIEYGGLMQTLFAHAKKQHFLVDGHNWVLAMYHDNPEFGEASQFRTSLCLTVPENIRIQEDGVLGRMKLEGGLYAVGYFQIQKEQYSDAWNYMYQEWIAGSGYVFQETPTHLKCIVTNRMSMRALSMRWTSTFPLSPFISNMLQIDLEVRIWKKSRFKERESII